MEMIPLKLLLISLYVIILSHYMIDNQSKF